MKDITIRENLTFFNIAEINLKHYFAIASITRIKRYEAEIVFCSQAVICSIPSSFQLNRAILAYRT